MTTSPKFSDQTLDNDEYLECHKLYLEQDDIELVKAYDKLARIYFKKYMYDNAIEYFQKAQSILTELNRANEPEMARLSHNLAATLCKRGRFDEAIQSFNNAVSILQLYRGKHELNLASTYENLGNTLTMKSSYNEALENLEKSLELKMNKLGENSPQVGDTLSSMGFLFIRLEDFDKALDYLNKALKLKVNHLGDHFEISAIHEEIAGSWGRKQNYFEAIKSLEKALALKEKYYKKDHYVYTRTYSMLGIASELQGLPEKAIDYLNKSIELKRKNLHENHLQFAVDYYYLGRALLSQSKHSEALENFMKCSEIYNKNIGKVNPYSKLINDAIEMCLKKSSENSMCTICLDELRKDMNVSYLQCTHAFHADCIDSWRAKGKNTCPVCRLQLFDI